MVTLKQLKQAVDAYLLLHPEDKEITSIGTHNGSSDIEYEIHLCDVYDGPIGTNPYTNRDSIKLFKDGEQPLSSEPMQETSKKGLKAYFELERRLRMDTSKPIYTRMTILWGALEALQLKGEIDVNKAKALWLDFALKELDLD